MEAIFKLRIHRIIKFYMYLLNSQSFIIRNNQTIRKCLYFSELIYDLRMSISDETKIGSKGEILPKLPLREMAGLSPGDRVLIEAKPGELRIRKILSIDDIFDLPKIADISAEEAEDIMDEEGEIQEMRVD